MKTSRFVAACCLFAAGAAGTASADVAIIDGLGGPLVIESKSIGGLFGTGSPIFSDAALALANAELQADGIVTDGRVTFLLAKTGDAGLSFVVLVDDENQPGDFGSFDAVLGMASTAPDTSSLFVNEHASDIAVRGDLGNGSQLATGQFDWDSVTTGDGFAWGNLGKGDFVAFNFTKMGSVGLASSDTFQFATFNGVSWEIADTASFTNNGQFAFSFQVIPAPGAMALLGVAGLISRRRRRAA